MLTTSFKNMSTDLGVHHLTYARIRTFLIEKKEIAILDAREEAVFAAGHPLFAANFPYSRIEIDAFYRIPRLDTPIVVYDDGEGLAEKAARKFQEIGYSNVSLLEGGLEGWKQAGGEVFSDVNSPSKAFGELVEARRHTPFLSADEVVGLIGNNADIVILDARRYDEYHTMNIPTSLSVPGGELVLRARQLVQNPSTKIIVNCAGRTRSIIGTQSLINAGIPNPVFALRNGTIGWTLAGQTLEHGQQRTYTAKDHEIRQKTIAESREVAGLAGVKQISLQVLNSWLGEQDRTTYCFDVRTQKEYEAGHLPGFRFVAGGQLVQETDYSVPVRGARIVLADHLEVRANMTASWLAQMGWEVYVLELVDPLAFTAREPFFVALPVPDSNEQLEQVTIDPAILSAWLDEQLPPVIVDLSPAVQYHKGHIAGAWYVLRSDLKRAVDRLPKADRYVLTATDPLLAIYAYAEFTALTDGEVFVLRDGTQGWVREGYSLESGDVSERNHFASPQIDRYRRPYEGTDNSTKAMQDYLEWEYGLVDQLERDGTHGFYVV